MTDGEIRAYTAGYNFAFAVLKNIIHEWAAAKELHDCKCSHCSAMREIAEGKFGETELPDYLIKQD